VICGMNSFNVGMWGGEELGVVSILYQLAWLKVFFCLYMTDSDVFAHYLKKEEHWMKNKWS
jgi:hypothetical protein